MNGCWILLLMIGLVLAIGLPLGLLVRLAIVGDKTRRQIHGDD